MIKVYFDTKPLRAGHAVRGIGVYTRTLESELGERTDIKLVDSERDADIVHRPYFDLFSNTLQVENKPTIITIYDVIPLIYPRHYPPGLRGKVNFLKQKRALKNVDAVITISETSKKDIVRFLDVTQEKIYVTHLAPGRGFVKMETAKYYGLPERFVLYVGDVNYNKNLLALAAACKKLNTPLVIVGKQAVETNVDWSHPENKPFGELIEAYGSDALIQRVGFVPEEDLIKLYNLATVYCQPSLYEGFGLPVLEAMACGTPVVGAKIQALVEIAEEAAVFVNPKSIEDVALGLMKVLKNPELQRELSRKGLEHVKRFSWVKTADETLRVYQKVLK